MTQEKLIIFLMFLLLVEVLCMRYFWLRSEKDEEEIKRLERENKELKAEIERKDRLLEAWEKGEHHLSYLERLQTMSEEEKKVYLMGNWTYTSHPCERCDTGWAGVDGDEVFHTCRESCERLAAWNEKQKVED